jgi:cytochrome c
MSKPNVKRMIDGPPLAWLLFLLVISIPGFPQQPSSQNSSPVVTITAPVKGSNFQWNSIVPFSITVSDKEDGYSAYGEIEPTEVVTVVSFLPDSSGTKKYLSNIVNFDFGPLEWMAKSGCFTCHTSRSKLIGPSLEEIAKRYKNNQSAIDAIVKKVISGSTGIWGDLKMPPHPDLQPEKIKEAVLWILKRNSDPNVSYFVGISGSFKTTEKPVRETGREVYVMTSTYIDHGSKKDPMSAKRGQQSVVLRELAMRFSDR